MLIAAAVLAPVASTAQTTACERVNAGSFNYSVTFSGGQLVSTTGARQTSTSADIAFNSIRGTATSDQTYGTAHYDTGGRYAFVAGDVINVSATVTNFSGATSINTRFRTGIDATTASFVASTLLQSTANGTRTTSYTATGDETSIGVLVDRSGASVQGAISITATCVAAASPPSVTAQPGNQIVAAGATASFSVTASGQPSPAVQWQVSSDGGQTFTNIAGATASTLTFTTIPADSGKRYRAVLTNSLGTATTNAATLIVVSVTSIAPTSGPTTGGTQVTINGTGFDPDSNVVFGTVSPASVTLVSTTQLRANAPAGTGTVNVRVTTAGATSPANAANAFTYLSAPVVNSVSPAQGPTAGGTVVTITGTGFAAGATVRFGGVDATGVTVNSATQITATAPAGSGVVNVTVTTANGTSATDAANQYTYVAAPTVNALAPTAGPSAGGTTVTITGTNLSGATSVIFGATAATGFTVNSATQLTATAPAGTGTVDVRVTTAGGTSPASAADQYTYVAAPSVTSVSPSSGSTAGGTAVTITGTNFTGASAVTIGGTVVTGFTVVSATQITATSPAGSAGAKAVVVTTPGGTATLAGAYTYVTAPVVNAISPAQGPVAGGTSVTIIGTGFTGVDPATGVRIGGTLATGVTINSNTQLVATTPAGTIGLASVTVTNAGGTNAANTLYRYVGAPTANDQSLSTIVNTATPITLTGTDPNTPARTLTYTVGTQPVHGTLSGAAPNLTYTPTAGYAGADSFTFTVSNGVATSAAATVSITVGQGSQTITFTSTAPADARVRGASYTVTATATSGQPVTFTSSTTNICTVSGSTVAFVGAGTCTIAANQGGNASYTAAPEATQSFTVAGPTIAVSPPPGGLPGGTVGVAYSVSATASGGTAPYSYAITAGALPPGFTLNTATGSISGTPTRGGSYAFTVTASDSTAGAGAPFTGSAAYTINLQAPTITVAPASLPNAVGGQAYSQQLTASGGTAPYSYAVTAGSLPAGVTLSATGLVSGTPTQSGNFTFTVTATDGSTGGPAADGGYTGSRSYQLTVGAPQITVAPTTIPGATAGQAYSQALTAAGGSGSYTYALSAGALPAGITLSTDGVISGTATAGGNFSFTVTVTDSGGFTGARSYVLSVAPATIVVAPATLADATRGGGYTQTLTATGGTAPYSYSVTAGTLPPGLTLAADGTLSGSATQVGSYTFTVTARDSSTGNGPFAGSRSYTVAVTTASIVVTPDTLPAGTTRVAYSQTLTASGGTGPYTYAVTAGALPGGITLAAGGTLSGSATAAGTFNFTATATDSFGNAGSRGYTLTISAPAITLAPATLPAATTRVAYSQMITASGGTSPYAYAVTEGALPTGLTLSSSGTLSGGATTAGTFNFTITATDANGNSGNRAYTLTVGAPTIVLAPDTLPATTTRVAYNQTLTATGGTAPYTFAVTSGALPAGLTLGSGGTFSGAATAAGTFNFTVTATDANGNSGTRAYTLTVGAPTIAIAPDALPTATTRVAYRQTLAASGGVSPYTYGVTAGALPPGITIADNGILSGSAITAGDFAFTVTAADADGNAGSRAYTLTVAAPAITLAPNALPAATTRVAYSQTLSAAGGTGPYGFTVVSGAPPAGITLSTGGTFSGAATAAGTFNFTVTATDANGNSGNRAYTLTVTQPAIGLSPAALAEATVGAPYAATLSATDGSAPYRFTFTGALPAGVTLAESGALSGTPTAGGSFAFTATVTDSNGNTATRDYTLVVQAAAIALTPASLPDAQQGAAFTATVSATGGTAPYAFTVTAGRLPAGVMLSAQGTLSGTPTENGRFPVSITATDSSSGSGPFSATRAYTLVVGAPAVPSAGAVALTIAYGAAATPVPLSLQGGTATRVAVVTAPQRGTATVDGLAITYAPAPGFAGIDTFTYTASNAGGTSAPATVTVTVAAPSVTLAPATLAAAQQDVAYQATLTATGGTAPYRFAVSAGRLPAGLTLSGSTIAGTPTESGSFAFSVTATDASTGDGPFSATRAYTLAVALPNLPVAQDSPARSVAATSLDGRSTVDIDLSALVSGNVTDIRVASQPRNGTVTLARMGTRFVATYSPNVDYRGADAFTFTATGPGGSATATVPLTVTGVAPVAPALRATVDNGQTVEVNLTTVAGGGPFTGATVVSTSPADAVTATVVETGTGSTRQFALRIAAVGRFSGAATVTYTLANAFGTSAPAVIAVTVTARPDPAQDATVSAMSTAQVEAARRFAQTQIDNFSRRTEQLHNGGAGSTGSPMGIQFGADLGLHAGAGGIVQSNQVPTSDVLEMKMEHASSVRAAERASGLLDLGVDGRSAPIAGRVGVGGMAGRARALAVGGVAGADMPSSGLAATQTNSTDTAEVADDGSRRVGSTAIWSGGAVAIGMRDATRQRNRLSVSSGGLSAGVDLKVDEALTLGVGGGYGADRTRIGRDERSRVDSESWMGAAYGSFQPARNAFVDAVIGGGGLRFDSIRDIGGGAAARGRRDGSMWFGSLSAGLDRTSETWRLSAYGRADYLSADFDGYVETGGGLANLRFAKRDLTSLTGLVGLRGSFVSGRWVPRLRAEYRHEFKRSGAQALDYADLSGFGFAISDDRWLRDALSAELGTDYMLGRGWQLGADIGGAVGSGTVFGTGKLSIRKQF